MMVRHQTAIQHQFEVSTDCTIKTHSNTAVLCGFATQQSDFGVTTWCLMHSWKSLVAAKTCYCVFTSIIGCRPCVCVSACVRVDKKMGVRRRWCRLTWHDPLADQFLSGASLLEFELENCMGTEGGEREGDEEIERDRGRERVRGRDRARPESLSRWGRETGETSAAVASVVLTYTARCSNLNGWHTEPTHPPGRKLLLSHFFFFNWGRRVQGGREPLYTLPVS